MNETENVCVSKIVSKFSEKTESDLIQQMFFAKLVKDYFGEMPVEFLRIFVKFENQQNKILDKFGKFGKNNISENCRQILSVFVFAI